MKAMRAMIRFFRSPARGRSRAGLTLVELLIALAVLAILSTTLFRIFTSQEKFVRKQELAAAMQEDLRSLSEFLNQEMSWAGYKVTGIAVQHAATTMCVFSGNIPGLSPTSTVVSYIAYIFDPSTRKLYRGVGATLASVQLPLNANHRVLADHVDSVNFGYFDFAGGQYTVSPTAPLVLGTHDNALAGIQRIRVAVTIRSPRPDNDYLSPQGDHYYRRSGVVDVKLRNIEDVSISGTSVGTGGCGFFELTVAPDTYSACADTPVRDISGNPSFHVDVHLGNGSPDNTTPVYLSATHNYDFVNASDPNTLINVSTSRVAGSGDLYLMAGPGCTATAGDVVTVIARYTPTEAGCVELTRTRNVTILPGMAAHLDTTGSFAGGIETTVINLDSGVPPVPAPAGIPVCSSTERLGVKLRARVNDSCGNPITGETVTFAAARGRFSAGTVDEGDGTYTRIYYPPFGITSPADSDTVTVSWGAESYSRSIPLVAGAPRSILVNDITGPVDGSGSPLYQFAHPTADAFQIERLSNQHVTVNFSVVDACGNRVFDAIGRLTAVASRGTTTPIAANGDGTYSFDWYWPGDCGAAIMGQTIIITDAGILPANPKTVAFDLLAATNIARLQLSLNFTSGTTGLTVGCTADAVTVTAQIQRYDPLLDLCINVPGPFPVRFTVAGLPGKGNGSFSSASLTQTTITATADGTGRATVTLYPGTSLMGQILTVNAVADIDVGVASDTADIGVSTRVVPAGSESGFYAGAAFDPGRRVGSDPPWPARAFAPGSPLYLQIQDCDRNDPTRVDPGGGFDYSIVPNGYVVTLVSGDGIVTRDTLRVKLVETGADTTLFRPGSAFYRADNGVPTANTTVGVPTDSVLQVRPGDEVTMTYEDGDGVNPAKSWKVWAAGARTLTLYKVNDSGTLDTIILGGSQPVEMRIPWPSGTLKYAPELFMPQYQGDGWAGAATVSIANTRTGGPTKTFLMREVGDTGTFRPLIGTNDYVMLSRDLPPPGYPDQGWLTLPTTPTTVTVMFPPADPTHTESFLVADSDPPACSVTAPGAGAVVSGTVGVSVFAEDSGNSLDPGIGSVELFVDGVRIGTVLTPANGASTAFSWRTVDSLGRPVYLDGAHRIWAVAYDKAGNQATSPIVQVTLQNGLSALWFEAPPTNMVWSGIVPVTLKTSIDTSLGSYTFSLVIGLSNRPLTQVDPTTYTFNWDTRAGDSDGLYTLTGMLRDAQANSTSTATLNAVVDHTAPAINLGTPPAWIRDAFPVTGTFTVSDLNGVAPTSVAVTVTGACPGPVTVSATGVPDQYQLNWAGPCANTVGSVTFTVVARDLANPPNQGTRQITLSLDTRRPVMDPLTVTPLTGASFNYYGYTNIRGFLRGRETISGRVADDYPAIAGLEVRSLGEPAFGVPGTGVAISTYPAVNPVTGAFSHAWSTTGQWSPGQYYQNGIYLVAAGGADLAGNTPLAPVWGRYYLDNGVPLAYGPYVTGGGAITPAGGNLYVYGDPNAGVLSEVEVVVVDPGASPDTAAPLFRQLFSYPLQSFAGTFYNTATWRPTVPEQSYDGYVRARDWAGNLSPWRRSTVPVSSLQLRNASGIFVTAGPLYQLIITGQVLQGGLPAGNIDAVVSASRYDSRWGSFPNPGGTWDNWSLPAKTLPDGTFSITVPLSLGVNPGIDFHTGEKARVWFYLGPSRIYNGYLTENTFVPDPLVMGYNAGDRALVLDPAATLTPMGGTSYQLGFSGVLSNRLTGAIAGTTVNLRFYQRTQSGALKADLSQAVTSDPAGRISGTFIGSMAPGDRFYLYVYDSGYTNFLGYVYNDRPGWRWPCPLNIYF